MGSRDGLEVVCEAPKNCLQIVFSVSIVMPLPAWNYPLYSLLRLSFFQLIYFRFIHVVAFITSSFLFITE